MNAMYVIRVYNSEGAKGLLNSCSLVRRTKNTYYFVFGLKYIIIIIIIILVTTFM